jgi:hypothetical protein
VRKRVESIESGFIRQSKTRHTCGLETESGHGRGDLGDQARLRLSGAGEEGGDHCEDEEWGNGQKRIK